MVSKVKRGIALAVILGLAGLPAGVAGSEEGPAHVSDPCEDLEPGAASPEPAQEIEEEVHDASQLAWIEGIWSTP
jgi:hypothetical protein